MIRDHVLFCFVHLSVIFTGWERAQSESSVPPPAMADLK